MAEPVLVSTAIVHCPHGGFVQLSGLVDNRVRVSGAPVVVPGPHPIVGCGFVHNGQFTPCLQVVWVGDSVRLSRSGARLIIKVESGICLGAGSIFQGNAVPVTGQNRVRGV